MDYLKLDGCYNNVSGFEKGYPAMGAALQGSGRDIVYSCSWPAYLGGNESAKPFAAMVAAGCNLWRNWEDIDCGWSSLVQIIGHWGEWGRELAKTAGPGHWHDPDMLLIGNDCLTLAEEQTQLALWAISAAPLIMGNDLRNISAESKAVLLNKHAIAVSQVRREVAICGVASGFFFFEANNRSHSLIALRAAGLSGPDGLPAQRVSRRRDRALGP